MTGFIRRPMTAFWLCVALVAVGCSGKDGATGATGATGAAGTNALVALTVEAAGANCATGGTRVDSGLDADGDAVLDASEVSSTRYVCHGVDGATGSTGAAGFDALVATSIEAAGPNCASGGVRLDSGVDLDRDGLLDVGEITGTQYACNGAAGADGATGATGAAGYNALASVTAEPAGANCNAGGSLVQSGLDTDRSGVLDAGEVTFSRYVCNGVDGVDGLSALVLLTPEPIGTNCAAGGTRVDSGLDANRNGVLDLGEVTSTAYACAGVAGGTGATGADGYTTLVAVTLEGPGACTYGGNRIDSGLDLDRDVVLDPGEVTATTYACNAAPGVDGYNALVAVTAEPAGANCAYGGSRIDGGLDLDRSGVLDPAEVTSTQYLCNVDTRDPEVVAWTPGGGAVVIANDQVFTVTFSEAMDPTTIVDSTVYLLDENTGLHVPATLSWDGATFTATLVPDAPLAVGGLYSLRAEPPVRDLEGNALAAYFRAEFSPNLDVVAPALLGTSPVDGAGCSTACVVSAFFSEPLAAESVTGGRFQLVDGGGTPVAGTVAWNPGTNAIDFTPGAPLADGATYTASLDVIAADAAGNARHVTAAWTFGVEARVRLTGPPNQAPTTVAAGTEMNVTLPVNGVARSAYVCIGTDLSAWYMCAWSFAGNGAGEGVLQGTITVPGYVTPGSYSVWVVLYDALGGGGMEYFRSSALSADLYTTFDEVTSASSVSTTPIAFFDVTAGAGDVRPDLTVTITSAAPVDAGSSSIGYSVTSTGGAAGPSVLGIFVDSVAPVGLYAVPDAWIDLAGIAAGQTVTGTVTVNRPVVSGSTVAAFVDLMGGVPEADETNNLAIIQAYANLVTTIDSITVTGVGTADVAYTVTNAGTFQAGPFSYGLFVEPVGTPTVGATPTWHVDYASLDTGASASGVIQVTTTGAASRFVGFADVYGAVAESSEADNLARSGLRGTPSVEVANPTIVAIPDNTTVTSATVVSGGPTAVHDLTVTVNITHTWDSDLVLTLVAPNGTRVALADRCGGPGDNFSGTVFDDLAAQPISGGAAPFAGTFRPAGLLEAALGQPADGTWTLEVRDAVSGDTGTINSWTLTLW